MAWLRLGPNHLLGKAGDHQNAVLNAAGHNLRLILNRLKAGKGANRLFLVPADAAGRVAGVVRGVDWAARIAALREQTPGPITQPG